MTREEEIRNAAFEYIKSDAVKAGEEYTSFGDFINGAKWADEHPVNYDGKAMLYVNNKSHENGYKEAVDKACEWLEKNVADIYNSPCNPDKIVEDFRKAMKGE